jgi:elongation factor P--(R)-beta-lysine ligase
VSPWRPSAGVPAAKQRAALLARVRSWFESEGVLAVDTPALGAAPVTDPNIASLAVGPNAWLQSSPEYYMKRLLAAGYPDIYSIARVFRDGETGRRHLREFTLIEWYRRDFDLGAIINDALALIAHVHGSAFHRPPEVIDYRDAFRRHAGVDPSDASIAELADAAGADARLSSVLAGDRDAWLDLLMATVVSPRFPAEALTVVRHYPASQAALARLCPADPSLADRFEIFAGTLELANGYVELTGATEQAARMAADLATRERRALPKVARDRRLLAALAAGLPACAGVALGFERLQMLVAGSNDIRNVVTFAGDDS